MSFKNLKGGLNLNRLVFAVFIITAVVVLLIAYSFNWDTINSYQSQNTDTLTYLKGKVVSVDSEQLEQDTIDSKLSLGEQELTIQIISGDKKGEIISVTNYLTRVHNILAKPGMKLIVCADEPEGVEPYYTVFNYDRTGGLLLLFIIFIAVMIAVGGIKGIKALAGIFYSIAILAALLIPAIYHGMNAALISLIVVAISAGISILLLNGVNRRTLCGFVSTFFGTAIIAVLFLVFSNILHITGFNTDAAETLAVAADTTGLSVRWLLFVCVLVSGLGAVMDVAVSLTASLEELLEVTKDNRLTKKGVFASAMNIGRDMIGTMSNTLILAFAGTSLNTFLCLIAYGYSKTQLMSSDFLTVELSQSLCATTGVVLTVPATALIFIYINKNRLKG